MSSESADQVSSTDTEPTDTGTATPTSASRAGAIDFEGLGAGEEIDVTYESTHGGQKTVRACVLSTRVPGYLGAAHAQRRNRY